MSDPATSPDGTTIVGGFLVVTALLFLIPAALMRPELAARTTGGLYQLLGIAMVAIGIIQIRKRFSLPALREIVGAYLRRQKDRLLRVLGMRPKTRVIGFSGTVHAHSSFSADLRVGLNKEGTLEDQVRQLQRFAEELHEEAGRLRLGLQSERNERLKSESEERKRRTKADRELQQTLKELAVGGLHLEWVGVAWLMLGTIILTWPELSVPMSRFFHP